MGLSSVTGHRLLHPKYGPSALLNLMAEQCRRLSISLLYLLWPWPWSDWQFSILSVEGKITEALAAQQLRPRLPRRARSRPAGCRTRRRQE
jgi:hypothetical protein